MQTFDSGSVDGKKLVRKLSSGGGLDLRRVCSNGHSIDPPQQVAATEYRNLMSAFPTGVTVVTTADKFGNPRGMTCSSLTSVTISPPTLLICLRLGSLTLDAIRSREAFAVNFLNSRGRSAAELFAAAVPDRFARVRWQRTCSDLPWLIDDAFAIAECQLASSTEVGDHAVVLGQVRSIMQTPDSPLLYGLRHFSSWSALATQRDGVGEGRHPGQGEHVTAVEGEPGR